MASDEEILKAARRDEDKSTFKEWLDEAMTEWWDKKQAEVQSSKKSAAKTRTETGARTQQTSAKGFLSNLFGE